MYPAHNYSTLRTARLRRPRLKSRRTHLTQVERKRHRLTTADSSSITDFHAILKDLRRSSSRFSLYTITELEPICQQLALQRMSPDVLVTEYCPLLCTFCQNLIYEPITLNCGHTFCDQCIKNEQSSSIENCPRCPQDIQGQIQSSIIHARENSYKINRFLKELLERSEKFKRKNETMSLCHKGILEFTNGNFQKAIDIYTIIIDQCKKSALTCICFFIN